MTERPWPADAVERRPLKSLLAYAKNARTHSDEQVRQIAASMREWGFTMPVLVDPQDEIIAGHGRIMAAELNGYETVPVMVAKGWTARQIKAYRIADNQLALNAAWDVKLLAAELEELPGLVELIGFDDAELTALLRGEIDTRPLPSEEEARKTLAQRFGLPPFSVLSARDGWWQERKRAWLALGIQSELGRGETAGEKLTMSETVHRLKPKADKARANATVKGSPMPAADYSKSQARGDGRGRAMANGKGKARAFAQDLMKGEGRIKPGESANVKTGLTYNTTITPYRPLKGKKPNGKA